MGSRDFTAAQAVNRQTRIMRHLTALGSLHRSMGVRRHIFHIGSMLIAISALGLVALPVFAASSNRVVYTDGSRAGEAWFNRGDPAFFDLYDAKGDSHPVYVEFQIDDGGMQRFNNNDGVGHTVRKNLQSGDFTIRYRVCVNRRGKSDPCSKFRLDHN